MISKRAISTNPAIEGRTLSGYAALYNDQSKLISERGATFRETISPGAFSRTLDSGADVKLYYNHNTAMPLARTKSGTLSLRSDANGLAFTASLPETTLGNDVRALLERGDLTGEMSFGFRVISDTWNKPRTERTINQAELLEISIVQDAAYPNTTSALRANQPDAISRTLTLRKRNIENAR